MQVANLHINFEKCGDLQKVINIPINQITGAFNLKSFVYMTISFRLARNFRE